MKKAVFFKRLFYAYTLIVLIYALIASSIYFYNQNVFSRKNIEKQNKVFIEQAGDKIDTKLRIAFNLTEQLKTNSDVIKYASNSKKDYYNILRIHLQLSNHLDAFSQFGYRIGIGKVGDEMMITPQYTIRVNDDLENQGFYSFNKKQIDDFLVTGQQRYFLHSTDQEENSDKDALLCVSQEIVGNKSDKVLFFLSFNKNKLLPTIQQKSEDLFFIIDDKNTIIVTQNEGIKKIEKEILSSTMLEQIEQISDKRGNYYLLKDDNYYAHVVTSAAEVMPWKYVYMTPKNVLYSDVVGLRVKTLLIGIILLLIGMLLALLISKKMYRPVGNILTSFEKYSLDKQESNNKSQDEFAYIQQTVNQINETNIKLQEAIVKNQEPLKIKFLRDLIHGILSKQQIIEKISGYDLYYLQEHSVIVVLQYVMDQEIEKNLSSEAFLTIKKQVSLWIKQKLREKTKIEIFELDYKRCVLLLDENDILKVKSELNDLLLELEEKFEVNMIAAIGKPADSIEKIKESFDSALNLLEYQFIWGNRLIIIDEDLREFKNEMYYYPLDTERVLIDHVLKGRTEEVNYILDRILEENLMSRNLAPDVLSEFIFAIVSTSHRIMHQMAPIDKQIVEKRQIHYIELKMSESKEELKQKIIELFGDLVADCVQEMEKREDGIINEMISFIHENYDTDLSLTDIAEHFNLSSGYVGILFKKGTGENFKDYLNIYKVKRAKEILENEDIKIKDLAQRVGCNTTNTFIRMFKKYEGISPGQYSEQVKQIREK